MPHKLSLVVPGLCGPLPGLADVESAAMPLIAFLQRFRKVRTRAGDYPDQLVELFGLAPAAAFPHAALTLLAHGEAPGDHCWVHADPVNLQADMDRAVLSDSQTLSITRQEAEQLTAELNAHFAADGIRLYMADRNNWLVRIDPCELATTPLRNAVGRNINYLLPTGAAAAEWKRLMNEGQMLLHISPVNQAREQSGQPAVNSLWLWGEGVLPQAGKTDVTRVYADDHAVTGIAKLNAISHSALTDPVVIAQAMQQPGHGVVVLDQLDGPCNYGDSAAWLDAMLELVDDWLEPLLAAAQGLDAVVNVYPCNGVRYHSGNNNKLDISKLMFWKKDRLGDYVETHQGT